MYTHPLFEAAPLGADPDPWLKPGPVFVNSGGVIKKSTPGKLAGNSGELRQMKYRKTTPENSPEITAVF
jgi:hypothetical protein